MYAYSDLIVLDLAERSPEILTIAGKEQHLVNKYK